MIRMFEAREITKLLAVTIGNVEAVGETNEDERRLDNLKTLIDVTNWCLDGLQFAMASGCGRPEYSMAEISYTAQCALDEYGRWIADVLDEQIADRKDEPQYDFGAFADRLWKIAYERGKREALEQTEPSCDTCKLKDTTEWCKRQEVCRAYKPKDEPQTCFNCKHNVVKHTFDHACGGCINMDSYEREDEQSGKE